MPRKPPARLTDAVPVRLVGTTRKDLLALARQLSAAEIARLVATHLLQTRVDAYLEHCGVGSKKADGSLVTADRFDYVDALDGAMDDLYDDLGDFKADVLAAAETLARRPNFFKRENSNER